MRVIVFSDSHGNTRCMDKAISAIGSFDAIIHLGDIERDVRYLRQKYAQCPIYSVLGNNDFFSASPNEMTVELEGVRLYLCHGHTRGVRSGHGSLIAAARARDCCAALYGHTHVPVDKREDGILIFNPGSCSQPRRGNPSFGILEIENGKCQTVIVDWVL